LQISYDEKGCPIPSVGFDYDSIDGIEEEEETLEKQCLTDILYFINGNGSIEDIQRRSLFLLNIVKKDLRPSLRISLTGFVIPAWQHSPIAERIADFFLQGEIQIRSIDASRSFDLEFRWFSFRERMHILKLTLPNG
jgi:hypothetical protein